MVEDTGEAANPQTQMTSKSKASELALAVEKRLLGRGADWYPRLEEHELANIVDEAAHLPELLAVELAARVYLKTQKRVHFDALERNIRALDAKRNK